MANNENLKPFRKGTSGNPKGRPRKFVSKLKNQGYAVSEINDALKNLLAMNLPELKQVLTDKNATILEQIVANALVQGFKRGNLQTVETLLSRTFGRPKESVDVTSLGKKIEAPSWFKTKND